MRIVVDRSIIIVNRSALKLIIKISVKTYLTMSTYYTYFTLGFRVTRSDFMRKMGAKTESDMTIYYHGHGFSINDTQYISREITHDRDHGGDYIVGLEIPFDVLHGSTMHIPSEADLQDLIDDWSEILIGDPAIRFVTDKCIAYGCDCERMM